jgi:UDP-N-acetylmuramoyl-L-alanyl-D-glutamate--2,6-diaminopimelate ligase
VTGTDGKTTTASLIFHILKTAGLKAAMITTVGAQIQDREYDTGLHTTTPSPFSLQKYIKSAQNAGCDFLVLEVTSHALDQNRILGVDFKIGVLTNITHEHLDYHGAYEKYVDAKSKLFDYSKIAVLNEDDESFDLLKRKLVKKKIFTYSLTTKADFNKKDLGSAFIRGFDFNNYNSLAAVSVAKILEIPDEVIKLSLSTFKFPKGRQEIVFDRDFKIIIDFAHTPNSFAKILPALKAMTEGRLIHVFGSAGKRDRSKRPLMGQISSKNADLIILTAEDPRTESVEAINKQIKVGIDKKFSYADYKLFDGANEKFICFEIPDRQEAINFAVTLARHGDTVVITGKGHEKSMNLGFGETRWSEHKAVEKALGLKLGK